MTDREIMQQSLDALEKIAAYRPLTFAECSDAEAVMGIAEEAIPALRERLAQPEQEPVAQIIALGQYEFPGLEWLSADHSFRAPIGTLLYTAPAQRKRMTDEQIEREWQFLHDEEGNPPDHHDFARAIESARGIKENT